MAKKYKPKTEEEIQKEWDKLNGDEFWGMTYPEFRQMLKDAILKEMEENPDFGHFVRGDRERGDKQ